MEKKVIVDILKHWPNICLDRVRETTENLTQYSWTPDTQLNQGPPK